MCERKVVTVNRTAAAVPGLHAPHAGHVARSRHDNQVAMTVHNFANGLIRVHPMGGGAYMYVP
jgi:PHP family Zn ribbon phosphoesterase